MRKIVFLLLTLITLAACTKSAPKAAETATTGDKNRVVNLAIWGNYFAESEQQRFTQLTGIKLNITNYSSNEELLAKVQAGAAGIDIAVPSDYMVGILAKMNLLEPLNRDWIPNAKELDPQFLKQDFDPENKFSLPYAWTTTGIAIQRELYKGKISGWKDLFNESKLAGKFSLLDDVRETLGVGAKLNGLSVNTVDSKDLQLIKKTLLDNKKKIRMFRTDTVDALANKEVAVAHAYSGDALQAWKKSKGQVEYLLPAEGGTWSIDNVVIFKGAKNVREAHELINFFYQPESNVALVKNIMAGPVLSKTRSMLPDEIKNMSALFPPKDKFSKLERIRDLGDKTREYDKIWTEVKSQ